METSESSGRFQWLKNHKTPLLLGVAALILAQVVWQFLYPSDKALPGAVLYEKNVGGMSRDALTKEVTEAFRASEITLTTPSTSYTTSLSSLGASVDAADVASQLAFYPVWQRILPLSIVWVKPSVDHFNVTFSDSALSQEAAQAVKKLSSKPVDAALAIKKGKLVVTTAKNGEAVTAAAVEKAVQNTTFTPDTKKVSVESSSTDPAVADASIEAVRKKAEAIINRSYTLQFASGKSITPKKNDVAMWLKISSKDGSVTVSPDKKAIGSYIAGINKTVATTGKTTYITLVDGVETARKNGTKGSAIAAADLTTKITNAINSTESVQMDVLMQPIPSPKSYTRSYTSTQKGLQAYVAYLASEEGINISVLQLSGSGWYANGGAYDSVVSASTYKLYVAVWVANQIKTGKMKLSDKMLDTTVDGCLERMIVISDNACAEAWIKKAGASKLNSFLYGKGISAATTFVNPDATHTSASDLQKVLLGIWNGSMVSGSMQSKITGYMGRQLYRQGIPAGSAGKVYDKVGFLWDYLNDAAIVVHPKGTYSLVIMTKGSSWGHIADITRQVEKIMYS